MFEEEPQPLYRKMQKFYLGKKEFDNKYILEKKYFDINAEEGLRAFHIIMTPKNKKPTASILLSHGLGEHGSRYIEIAMKFAEAGFVTYMYDFRGFGHSCNGPHFTTFKDMLEDIVMHMKLVRNDLPLFLMGHSMGGGTSLQLLRRNPNLKIAGVILHNPHIKFSPQTKFSKLDLLIFPYIPRTMELLFLTGPHCSAHLLVKSEKGLRDFYHDEFFEIKSTFKMLKTLLAMTNNLFTKINDNVLNYPCLNVLGGWDRMTPATYCQEYFKNNVICKDVTFKIYSKGFHNVIHDYESDEVCNDIINWVKKRTDKAENFELPNDFDIYVKGPPSLRFLKIILVLILAVFLYLIFK